MDQRIYIPRLNIEHYRQKLLTEKDDAIRRPGYPAACRGRGPCHGRQCVGRKSSIGFVVCALIQPLRSRRHGNTRACVPS